MQGISWNILGQTYVPKTAPNIPFLACDAAAQHLVPPHIHPDQDEYLYMLEENSISCGRARRSRDGGDLIRLGMGVPHGISTNPTRRKVLFWVSRPENSTICSGVCTT